MNVRTTLETSINTSLSVNFQSKPKFSITRQNYSQEHYNSNLTIIVMENVKGIHVES